MGTRIAAALAILLLSAAAAGEPGARPRAPVAVEIAPVPAPAAPAPGGKGEPLVGSIELHLSKDADPAGLAALVSLRPGTPLRRKDVRRTIERLYGTGRFADISVTASERPDGRLAIVIEAETRTWVDRVDFDGLHVLTEKTLRETAGLPTRRFEYYPEYAERIAERLLQAYRRVGHTRARISHLLLRGELGETVLSFQIQEREPTRIQAVHVAGDPQLPPGEILRTLGLAPGDVLDFDRLEKGVAALKERLRTETHYRARMGAPQISEGPDGAVVRLQVTAGPRVEFRFRGNDAFDAETLERQLAYAPEEPLDEGLVAQLEDRLESFYRLAGFADARVTAREVRTPDRRRSFLVFRVEEGAPLKVAAVAFEGNRHFTEAFLRERLEESLREAAGEEEAGKGEPDELFLGGRPSGKGRWVYDPLVVWFEPAYLQALARIVELYRADGYLDAVAEPPRVERDENRREARITLRLQEGPQTIVSEVGFPGAPSSTALESVSVVRKGRPLNSLEVETTRQAIQRALGHDGRVFARVDDEERFSPDRTEAAVAFRVTPGPRVHVGRILVQGLGRTHESVVRGALALEDGGLLDPEQLAQSQRNLIRLGIFRTVTLRMNAPEVPEEIKDVYVTVDERPTQAVTVGGGYSLVDGPRFTLEYTKINLLGRALQLSGRAKLNYVNLNYQKITNPDAQEDGLKALGRRLNLTLQYPRILLMLPVETGVRLDLVHELINRPAYTFQRSAAIVGTDVVAARGVSASLAYEIEGDEISKTSGVSTVGLSISDIERLRFAEGVIYLHSLRPTVSFDWRDDPANPSKGVLLSTTAELVQSLGGRLNDGREPHSLFIKASAQASVYVPLWRGAVFALSLKGGKVFPLDSKSETILSKRFFLGGANSMRGFLDDGMVAEDQRQGLREDITQCDAVLNKTGCRAKALAVRRGETLLGEGGELFTLGRAELRFPIAGQLDGALFFDAGNLWLDQSQYQPLRLRYAAGAGLRLVTPIGPAALDLGINLAPDRILNEAVFMPHFSIGIF